jgi:phosphate transport system protein
MATVAEELFRLALDAWAAQDPELAGDLVGRSALVDDAYRRLLDEILALEGPGAVHVAVTAVLVGRALERIADHTVIVGERLRYLLTGDPAYLASEVR